MSRPAAVLHNTKWSIVALMLLAFALRTYRLDAQSLWSDEGLSLYRARLALGGNLSNLILVPPGVPTQDTNPPLYFILLGGVRAGAGESEYALRFLSAVAGVTLVPLLYVTGRRLFSREAGLVSALLGTLSPFLVWYSQEARMYTVLATLSLASVYWLLRATHLPSLAASQPLATSRRDWIAWGLVTLAAVYTHFTAFFLLAFEASVILFVLARSRRREIILIGAGLTALSIPLVIYGWSRAQNGVDPSFGFRPLGSIVEEVWGAFLVGRTNETFQPVWAVWPGLLMAVVGLLGGWLGSSRRRGSTLFVVLYLGVLLLLFYAVTFVRPLYTGPRHLTLLAPPVYLLVGYGLALTGRRVHLLGWAALAWILILMILWLRVQFFDPAYLKDDMRSAARTIGERATARDVVVVQDAISSFVFDYYYRGLAPWSIIPTYPSFDVDQALREFEARAQSVDRVWLLTDPPPLSGFPPNALDEWARGHLLRLDHQRFPSIWLGSAYQLYTAHFPIFDALPSSTEKRNLAWPEDQLNLVGVRSATTAVAGQRLPVGLYWRLDAAGRRNLGTTLRLVDQSGAAWAQVGGTMFDNWSTRQWPVGKVIGQDTVVDLPADLPPGEYRLRLSVNERKSGTLLKLSNGSMEVELAALSIQR